MEFQNGIQAVMSPNYQNCTKDKFETWEMSISLFILDSIYDNRDKFEDAVKNPNKFSNQQRLSTSEIAKERKKYESLVVEVFQNIEDPSQLLQLGK